MASDLENKYKKLKSVNYDDTNHNHEIENKIMSYEVIDNKPITYKKKKSEITFLNE